MSPTWQHAIEIAVSEELKALRSQWEIRQQSDVKLSIGTGVLTRRAHGSGAPPRVNQSAGMGERLTL